MKTTKKALLLALCAVLLVVSTVFATLAYLQAETQVVRNTFTVGEIEITLDEAKVDLYGKEVAGADRVLENEYKLIPGHKYTKDPTVHVDPDSEKCYVFVEVINKIADIEDKTAASKTIATQMTGLGWTNLSGDIWYYNNPVDPSVSGTDLDLEVFEFFKIAGDAAVAGFVTEKDTSGEPVDDAIVIDVKAYAVQFDGFGTAQAAWTATFGA